MINVGRFFKSCLGMDVEDVDLKCLISLNYLLKEPFNKLAHLRLKDTARGTQG